MKKILISLLTFCSVFAMSVPNNHVNAVDFEGNESKYIKLCSSSLTNSNKKVCQQFNEYLSKKNSNLKKEISETKRINKTNNDISAVSSKISKSIHKLILKKKKSITYFLQLIILKKILQKKKNLCKNDYMLCNQHIILIG